MNDAINNIIDQVKQACSDCTPLAIQGGNSKSFLGNPSNGDILDISSHSCITSYEANELIITARAGTSLTEIEHALADNKQMLAFEPPRLSAQSTIGGSIAAGLSGPRRPYAGSARDFVLGLKIINGRGEHLEFGGQVMKNVAGYDVSRLMCGAMGTLGIITEVSLKVLPLPAMELTIVRQCNITDFISTMTELARLPLPISAACHYNDLVYIRLSGSEQSVLSAKEKISGDTMEASDSSSFWQSLRDFQHEIFTTSLPLWRLSLPPTTLPLQLEGESLIDWGGAQRWVSTNEDPVLVRSLCDTHKGHATLYKNNPGSIEAFQPLDSGLHAIHKSLKTAFDPVNILNPGRLYKDL